jgi:ABC-type multidrug transport system fused ATPase/permease subunit
MKGNVGLALRQASESQLNEAIRAAHAEDLLAREMPEGGPAGWDQVISNRTLSGGQKQRLAIARAILPDPAILVLDEATSQIDAESELKIRQAIHEVMLGRTTFIIAHRYSSITQVDRVVVMDAGRVVASGRHDELIRDCGLYRRLYETQFPNHDELIDHRPVGSGVAGGAS